jgi:hypothetical protein
MSPLVGERHLNSRAGREKQRALRAVRRRNHASDLGSRKRGIRGRRAEGRLFVLSANVGGERTGRCDLSRAALIPHLFERKSSHRVQVEQSREAPQRAFLQVRA